MTLISPDMAHANVQLAEISGDTIDHDTAQTIVSMYSFHHPMGVMPLFAKGADIADLDTDTFLHELQAILRNNWITQDTEQSTNELFAVYCYVREAQHVNQ